MIRDGLDFQDGRWLAIPSRNRKVTIVKRDPDIDESEDAMEFRLTYQGLLLGHTRSSP